MSGDKLMEPWQMTRTPDIPRHEIAPKRFTGLFIFGTIANQPAITQWRFVEIAMNQD
jgi:hypothetical protein